MAEHPAVLSAPFGACGFPELRRLPMSSLRRAAEIPLDGPWRFQLLEHPGQELAPHWQSTLVPSLWTMTQKSDPPHYTNVPMPFDEVPPALPALNPTGVYRRSIELGPTAQGRRLVLHVGAAESALRVLINGRDAGVSSDSHLAAEFDITDLVVAGTNEITLVVAKYSAESYLEDQDQWWHGGLSRSVFLFTLPEVRIADVVAVADYEHAQALGSLSLTVLTHGLEHLSELEWSIEVEALQRSARVPVTPRRATQTLPKPVDDRSARPQPRFPDGFMDLLSLRAAGAPVPRRLQAVAAGFAQTIAHEATAGSAHHSWAALDVRPWTAETPHLESVTVRLLDPRGRVVDSVQVRVGFRRVQILGQDLLLNGRRILIQGVARHDFDPRTGRVVSEAGMREELALMKRHNINAIRTSHYPNDPVLLDLCDEMGLYVVDEADIEGHAFAGSLPDDPRYLPAFLERYSRTVLRDRNHPSVIMWSLGNETGYGAAHDAMAAWSRSTDPTRPVHYEGAIAHDWHAGHAATDVVCPMYATPAALEAYAHDERGDRPLVLCEYAFSQGNSTGGLADYWRLFETLPKLQGGFIWGWRDQSLDPEGDRRYRYGGDFGDEPNSGATLNCGIVLPDLTPKPALLEARGVFAPIRLTSGAEDVRSGRLSVLNRQTFADLSAYRAGVAVETADGPVASHAIELPHLLPGQEAVIELPAPVRLAAAGARALALTLTLSTREDTTWATGGTRIALLQVHLGHLPITPPPPTATTSRSATGSQPVASSPPSPAIEHPLLLRAPQLCLWRALTENDRSFALDHRFVRSGFFDLSALHEEVTREADSTVVARTYRAAFGDHVQHTRRIRVLDEGDYLLDEHVQLPPGTRDGLRVGMQMELIEGFEDVEWVGLGPWENYPDRSSAALLGRWRCSIEELAVPYTVPQENGTRGGVRRLRVSGPAGTLRTEHQQDLWMNVSRHSTEDLESTTHWWRLPQRRTTTVHLDVAHRGVGTALLGPDTAPRHRLLGEEHRWTWRLQLAST